MKFMHDETAINPCKRGLAPATTLLRHFSDIRRESNSGGYEAVYALSIEGQAERVESGRANRGE
jgi:hypothetical protein